MTRILPVLALLLAASTVHAEEPTEPKLGEGAIAEACALEFPSDPEAAKACEVVVRLDRRNERETRLDRLEYGSYLLFDLIDHQDDRIAELQFHLETLEAEVARLQATKKNKKR